MNCIFNAAKIIRKSIFEFRKNKTLTLGNDFELSDEDVPAELFSLIKWITCGSKREICQLQESRRNSLNKQILTCASNLMYITKSDYQMKHDTYQDFRTASQNESKAVITNALNNRHYSRSKRIINALNENGTTISNNRALQIETSLANAVINKLKISPSGIELFPFLEKGNSFNSILIIQTSLYYLLLRMVKIKCTVVSSYYSKMENQMVE